MAKTVATILGVLFLLAALLGFIAPGFLGMHLSWTHTIVHLVSGLVSLYFGLAASLSAARAFDYIFGAVYGLLGLAGFIFGAPQIVSPTIPGMDTGEYILKVIPGALELGTPDHIFHIVLGLIYIVGAALTRTKEIHVHDAGHDADHPRRAA